MKFVAFAVAAIAAISTPQAQPGRVLKQSLTFSGQPRQYYVYDPPARTPDQKAPLLITLHGDRGDGGPMADLWRQLAEKEGFVLMSPISASGRGWDVQADPPDFFQALVDIGVAMHGVDDRRVYLFGFSAGGHFALTLAALEPEYFAAVATYAGVLMTELADIARAAERRIPITLIAGNRDGIVPLEAVRATHAGLTAFGWSPETVRMQVVNNDHNYRRISGDIQRLVWAALSPHRLADDPKFKVYKRGG